MVRAIRFGIIFGIFLSSLPLAASGKRCMKTYANPEVYKEPRVLPFDFEGLVKVASVSDPTKSTGATLFLFPEGGRANFDDRGGSVSSIETTLLKEGGYSNDVDGILFAGGSTMGLAATDGVREVIFNQRLENAGNFDFVPSVPGAVVFDFGGRVASFNERQLYPNRQMGIELMENLNAHQMEIGRAGAGTTTTANKIGTPRFGGQGMVFKNTPYGKIMVAVVLNPGGNVLKDGKSFTDRYLGIAGRKREPVPGQNTTLSIVITEANLDRSALKRLSVMVHTNMASKINPFHTHTDGDINFAVSVGKKVLKDQDWELGLAMQASKMMNLAIERAIDAANFPKRN